MSLGARLGWTIGGVAALAVAGIVAFGAAVSVLKGEIAEALGPHSETSAIHVGISGVVVEGLRIPAESHWPSEDALRAERVSIVPSLRSLVSGDPYRIFSVKVTRPYLSALRTRDGKLLLPALPTDSSATEPDASGSLSLRIGEIALEDAVFESFDARVATPPAKVRLEQVEASIHDVQIPAEGGRSRFELDGVVKGATHDGHMHLAGWIDLDTRDSPIVTELRFIDFVPFQHYLIQRGEAGIRAGRFDLGFRSEVSARLLKALGRIRLIGLELEPGDGAKDVGGAVLDLLKGKPGR